jgi:hypothetical protein
MRGRGTIWGPFLNGGGRGDGGVEHILSKSDVCMYGRRMLYGVYVHRVLEVVYTVK